MSTQKVAQQPSTREPAGEVERGMDALELAVVVPTFNERENIIPLVHALQKALDGYAFEIIFVDDHSQDATADTIRKLGKQNIRIRCIERFGRRGLSSAFLEGAMSTAAPVVAVIDGDMQHDESVLPEMLKTLRNQDLDVVIGSRYLAQGGVGDWAEDRVRASIFATEVARRVTGIKLSDPMSGFFMVRTEVLRGLVPRLSAVGFKILLDIFLSTPTPLRFAELPYQFRSRHAGESKMGAKVLLDFGELLIDKLIGHIVPPKFVMFAMVGSLGVLAHLAVLTFFFKILGVEFGVGQTVATLTAMTSNFALNNIFTYYDRRLSGWRWVKGWFSFALASSVGIIANVGVANMLFTGYNIEWVVSALAGILVGLVWNYVLTAVFTWRS